MFRRRQGGQGGNLQRLVTLNQSLAHPQLLNIDHLLPLTLQDFCLLRVINDLDGYPLELLASLPHWVRYRLLNNLPALDLCRLDHTTVAKGINVDQLWETRLQILTDPGRKSLAETGAQQDQRLFQLDLPQVSHFSPLDRFRHPQQLEQCSPALKEKVTSAFNNIKECPGVEMPSAKEKFLLNIASNFLFCSPNLLMDDITCLISIPGEHLLPNLVFASHHESVTPRHSYNTWKKQGTSLMLQYVGPPPLPVRRRGQNQSATVSRRSSIFDGCVVLTPHRLVSFLDKNGSSLRLLSLLVNNCGIQPTSANILLNKVSQEIVDLLYTARVAQESGLKVTTDSITCVSIIHDLLRRVIILKLQCKKYAEIGLMIEMIEAVTSDREQCQVRYLSCTLPDLYADIVHPLSTIISLQTFSQLSLELDEVYLSSLGKLLFAYLTAPCQGSQQLCIFIKGKATVCSSKGLQIAELATLDMKGATLPHCAIQHKVLEIFPKYDIARILYILLQWPTIRLKELALTVNYMYLHLCALHPDLQVMKLVIIIDDKVDGALLDTIQEDLVALLKMPTLEEFAIAAFWDRYKEAKAGLVQGLGQRSSLPPLRKIHIDEAAPGECTEEEYRELWNAIFALPQLDQLEIVLSAVAMGVLFKYLYTVLASWIETASGIKLKVIDFQSFGTSVSEDEVKLISHFTQTHSFITYEDLFRDS